MTTPRRISLFHPTVAKVHYVQPAFGPRIPIDYLAQLEYKERLPNGNERTVVETLRGEHKTEALALAAAKREIAERLKKEGNEP